MRLWVLACLLAGVGLVLLVSSGRERIEAIGPSFYLSGPSGTQQRWDLLMNTLQDVGMEQVPGGVVVARDVEAYAMLPDGGVVARTDRDGSEAWIVLAAPAPSAAVSPAADPERLVAMPRRFGLASDSDGAE